jgi:nicotinamidase-related amidase
VTTGPTSRALVLIEFQREWLDPAGKINHLMADREQFDAAVGNGARALAAARLGGWPVIHVGLRYAQGHPELGRAEHGLRAAIKAAGTFAANGPGSEFPPPFAPRPGEFVVSGRLGASAFSASNLDAYLRNNGISQLLLCGFALHVCVESTLREAHDRGYDAVLIEDATAAFSAEQRRHVLEEVVHHFGSRTTVDELLRPDPMRDS